MDGRTVEIPRDLVLGIFPAAALFRHPLLKHQAVFCHQGKIYPLEGPVASGADTWLLVTATHGHLIKGLPRFDDDPALAPDASLTLAPAAPSVGTTEQDFDSDEEARLFKEMEELLKSA